MLAPFSRYATASPVLLVVGWLTWALRFTVSESGGWFVGGELKAGKSDVLDSCSGAERMGPCMTRNGVLSVSVYSLVAKAFLCASVVQAPP